MGKYFFASIFAFLSLSLAVLLVVSPHTTVAQGSSTTLGAWQTTASYPGKGAPYPTFARGGKLYVHTNDSRKVYMGTPDASGNITSWQLAWNDHGGIHGFTSIMVEGVPFMFRNGHIAHYEFNADGTIAGNDYVFHEKDLATSFNGRLWVWDNAVYAPLTTGKYVYHLTGFSCPGHGCAVDYQYDDDIYYSRLPIGDRFTDTGSKHPGVRAGGRGQSDGAGKSAFFLPNGSADYGFIYATGNQRDSLWRTRVNSDGTLSTWSQLADIPAGSGNKRGDLFVIGNTLFAVRGSKVFSTDLNPTTGDFAGWNDNPPDLPAAQIDTSTWGGEAESSSWGVIGNYVYVTGNGVVYYAQINGTNVIPTSTPGGAATATPGTAATATPTTGSGCTLPSIPTNLQPTAVSSAGSRPVTWDQVAGATGYALRIDDAADGWDASAGCSSVTNNPQDVCVDNLTSPTYSYNFQTGHTYHIWVHAVNACGAGTAGAISVTVGGNAGTCTIQGYKTPVAVGNDADVLTLTDSQGASVGQTSAQPYYFNGLTGGQSYTVQAGNGNGKLVGSTLCYNRIDCHGVADNSNPDFQAGGTRQIICPGNGYVDLWWHYVDPTVVPTPTQAAGTATLHIKVQDASGNPVDALTLYTFQCISGVHDCNAVNFCERFVVGFRTPEYTRTPVPIGGNICRVGVGAILETGKMQMTSVAMSPVTDTLQDQWVPPNQNAIRIEHNFGWGSLANGQTYEAVMTVNATPTPTLAPGMCWGVEHCTTGGSTYFEYCGNCGLYNMAGCNPSYTCRQPNYTCKAFANTTFYFDEKYPVPCADIGIIPTVGAPTATPDPNQPTPTPVSAACEDQRIAGDYNCDGSVNTSDFKDWLRDFLAGTAPLKYLEYWRRALLTATATTPTPLSTAATNTPIPGVPTATPITPSPTAIPLTATTPQNSITCPTTSTNTYDAILIESSAYPSGDPAPQNHPDLNLAVRGFANSTDSLALIDTRPFADSKTPPQLNMMFFPYRTTAQITSVYKTYDWNWDHTNLPNHGTKGSLIGNPPVSVVGIAATPGEILYAPYSDYHIGQNVPNPSQVTDPYQVFLLYADSTRVTLKYARGDSVLNGYVVHLEDICVDPNLVGLYNSKGYNTPSNRSTLIAIRSKKNAVTGAENVGNPIGVARTNEVKVAVRAGLGSFIDPRSNTWWRTVPL